MPLSDWPTREEAAAFRETLKLREIPVQLEIPGLRTEQIIMITALLDALLFPPHEITQLCRRRWQARFNFRSLTSHMEIGYLRTKQPATIRNEFAMHLVAPMTAIIASRSRRHCNRDLPGHSHVRRYLTIETPRSEEC